MENTAKKDKKKKFLFTLINLLIAVPVTLAIPVYVFLNTEPNCYANQYDIYVQKDIKGNMLTAIADFTFEGGSVQNHAEFRICEEDVKRELTETTPNGIPLSWYVMEILGGDFPQNKEQEFYIGTVTLKKDGSVSVSVKCP